MKVVTIWTCMLIGMTVSVIRGADGNPGSSSSASINLAWDPSPDATVVGYALYYGEPSGSSTNRVDIGNSLNASVSTLLPSRDYFFFVVAYNLGGLESKPSNVLLLTTPSLPTVAVSTTTNTVLRNSLDGAATSLPLFEVFRNPVESSDLAVQLKVDLVDESGALISSLQPTVTISAGEPSALVSVDFDQLPALTGQILVTATLQDSPNYLVSDAEALAYTSVTVNPAPTAPSIVLNTPSVVYTLGDTPTALAPSSWIESTQSNSYAGNTLLVQGLTPRPADRISLLNSSDSNGNQWKSVDGQVSFNETTIASYSGGTTGLGSFELEFNANATGEQVNALLQSLAFSTEDTEYETTARTFSIVFTDSNGLTNSPVSVTVSLNHRAKTLADRVVTGADVPAAIDFSRFLANDSDPDGDAIHLENVDSFSARQGTLVMGDHSVTYVPPPWFSGVDRFSYTILDANGAATVGQVTVQVLAPGKMAVEDLPWDPTATNNAASLVIMETPGTACQIMATDDLKNWTALGTATTDSTGMARFLDNSASDHGRRFYRYSTLPGATVGL